MEYKEFPILEFDPDPNAVIRPHNTVRQADLPAGCVLCFFQEAITEFLERHPHRVKAHFSSESFSLPIYEVDYQGRKVALVQAQLGSPSAAAQIDEITAMGCSCYVACGSCGVLQQDIAAGHLLIPVSAVRDEGASYHYLAPSREVEMEPWVADCLEAVIAGAGLSSLRAKTWTTDAFYRETPAKIALRKQEGCVCVEMEASAYLAAARYNQVTFGQFLYAGDNLDGEEWDSRSYNTRTDVRLLLLELALKACLKLQEQHPARG